MSGSQFARVARPILLPLCAVSERLGNRFYAVLAVLLSLAGVVAIATNLTSGMTHQVFDLVMKHRFRTPRPDPRVVIVDIDEAALAAMAPEYGRWPWPRSVLGEFVEGISPQGPAAIVFDITFSDPDVYNPESDASFREVISRSPRTFFPMIRLNPENDRLSALKLARLPGVAPAPGASAAPEATLAVTLPYLFDLLDDSRLGTNNLYADDDGIVRSYHVYRDVSGWRVGSLPANLARALGKTPPQRADVLLNWRGPPGSYPLVPFHEVFFDLLKEKRARPPDEFKDKIVIIGSTAPSLFDLKPSSVARIHPGVEILATAIDNMKNGDYLSEVSPVLYMLVTVLAVSVLARAFTKSVDPALVNRAFTFLQGVLVAVTYLFLNYSSTFVDLTAPFFFGLVYFSAARIHSTAMGLRKSAHPWFSTVLDEGNECQGFLLYCRFPTPQINARRRVRTLLKRAGGLSQHGVVAPGLFKASPLLDAFFRDTLLLHWIVRGEKGPSALKDLGEVLERASRALARKGGRLPGVTFVAHAYTFDVDGEGQWRMRGERALAETLALAPAGDPPAGSVQLVASEDLRGLCPVASLDNSPILRKACVEGQPRCPADA